MPGKRRVIRSKGNKPKVTDGESISLEQSSPKPDGDFPSFDSLSSNLTTPKGNDDQPELKEARKIRTRQSKTKLSSQSSAASSDDITKAPPSQLRSRSKSASQTHRRSILSTSENQSSHDHSGSIKTADAKNKEGTSNTLSFDDFTKLLISEAAGTNANLKEKQNDQNRYSKNLSIDLTGSFSKLSPKTKKNKEKSSAQTNQTQQYGKWKKMTPVGTKSPEMTAAVKKFNKQFDVTGNAFQMMNSSDHSTRSHEHSHQERTSTTTARASTTDEFKAIEYGKYDPFDPIVGYQFSMMNGKLWLCYDKYTNWELLQMNGTGVYRMTSPEGINYLIDLNKMTQERVHDKEDHKPREIRPFKAKDINCYQYGNREEYAPAMLQKLLAMDYEGIYEDHTDIINLTYMRHTIKFSCECSPIQALTRCE